MLAFAINDRKSFEWIFQKDGLMEDIRKNLKGIPILVGCKLDLEHERKVSKEEAEVKNMFILSTGVESCTRKWNDVF